MPGQRNNPVAVAEREVMPPCIENTKQRSKDSDGRAVKSARIKKIDAQTRVELLRQSLKLVELFKAGVEWQAVIVAGRMRKAVQFEKRHGNFVI